MGYCTRHTLTLPQDLSEDVLNAILETRVSSYDDDCVSSFFEWDGHSGTTESIKWYDCEDDMCVISQKFPDVQFIIDGEGEESGDVWRAFFFNGQKETVTMPPWVPPTSPTTIPWGN